MMGDIAIRISDIHVTFGDHKVLKGASGLIRKGSIVTFLGRNGCGKSTLLKAVTGNLKPDKGSVEIAGAAVSRDPERYDSGGACFLRTLSVPALVVGSLHA